LGVVCYCVWCRRRGGPSPRWAVVVQKKKKKKRILRVMSVVYYKMVQIWPGQTVTCLHTNSPDHIWTTFYIYIH
jgi:hypothetical protein